VRNGRAASGGALVPEPAARHRSRTRVSTDCFLGFPTFSCDRTSPEGMVTNQLCRIVVGILSQIGRDGHRDMGDVSTHSKNIRNSWELWSVSYNAWLLTCLPVCMHVSCVCIVFLCAAWAYSLCAQTQIRSMPLRYIFAYLDMVTCIHKHEDVYTIFMCITQRTNKKETSEN